MYIIPLPVIEHKCMSCRGKVIFFYLISQKKISLKLKGQMITMQFYQ